MAGFLGMRGTGDWVTDQRPKNWREMILRLYPNGTAPLTAILSKMKSEKTDDPEFNWWTKPFPSQRATITGIYTNVTLVTAYVSGGVAGDYLYVKMSADDCKQFRVGHQVLLRDASDYSLDVVVKVTARSLNGASSYITVKLLEADDNSGFAHDLSDADVAMIIGNINPEGGVMPSGISQDPEKFSNYTQISRTPLSITRTARETKLRTGDAYQEMKREALEIHSIEMEKNMLFGIKTEGTGDNGKPERTTEGILTFIRENAAANVNDFSLNPTYSGKDWTDVGGGEDWLDSYLELLFRYGRQEKLALAGSGALLGLNKLARAGSHFEISTATKAYGIKISEWVTPFGSISVKTHPLFSEEVTLRNSILLLEPENLKYRFITDTKFYGEGGSTAAAGTNGGRVDGSEEEFLTEYGLEFHHPSTMMFLNNVGVNSSV